MRILAVDPSLTSTGICLPDGQTHTVKPTKGLSGPARHAWIRDWLRDLIRDNGFQAVAMEDYALGPKGRTMIDTCELGGVLRLQFHELRIPLTLVNPAHVKQWITGKGNADKAAMVSGVTDLAKRQFPTNDECDAWAIGSMAAAWSGQSWPAVVRLTVERSTVLHKVPWAWPKAAPAKLEGESQ
jgi:Holliday junction resolvasome RuvABC endonuclease subunit